MNRKKITALARRSFLGFGLAAAALPLLPLPRLLIPPPTAPPPIPPLLPTC